MKYLHPSELSEAQALLVSMLLDNQPTGISAGRSWYTWMWETWNFDPRHCMPKAKARLEQFNDAFAIARIRGEVPASK